MEHRVEHAKTYPAQGYADVRQSVQGRPARPPDVPRRSDPSTVRSNPRQSVQGDKDDDDFWLLPRPSLWRVDSPSTMPMQARMRERAEIAGGLLVPAWASASSSIVIT